jgi:hypothetical protein
MVWTFAQRFGEANSPWKSVCKVAFSCLLLHSSLEAYFHWMWALCVNPRPDLEAPGAAGLVWPSGSWESGQGQNWTRREEALFKVRRLLDWSWSWGIEMKGNVAEKMFLLPFSSLINCMLGLLPHSTFLWTFGPSLTLPLCTLLNLNSISCST